MKSVLLSTTNKLRSWLSNYRVAAAFLFGVMIAAHYTMRYLAYVKDFGTAAQCFETYIYMANQPQYFSFLSLGGLLLLSDAPFLTPLSPQEMLRLGRKKWLWSQILYIFVACAVYYLVILLFVSVLSSLMVDTYLLGGWSSSMEALVSQRTMALIENYAVRFFYPDLLQALNPIQTALTTILYNSMYLSVLCLPILCVNLISKSNYGWVVGSSIHFVGYMIYANAGYMLNWSMKHSLLCCAMPSWQYMRKDMSPIYCFSVLFACICITILICRLNVKKIEPFQ